jgi:hypothetical protein
MSKHIHVTNPSTPHAMSNEKKNIVFKLFTPLLYKTYCYIYDYKKKTGIIPTYREIGEKFGVTKQAVEKRIWYLIKFGAIKKPYYRTRSIELVGSKNDWRPFGKRKTLEMRRASRQLGLDTIYLNKNTK